MNEIARKTGDALAPMLRTLDDRLRRAYARLGPRGTAVLGLALSFFVVVLQNLDNVEIDILFWQIDVPKLLFFVGLTAFGFAFGYLAGTLRRNS